MKITFLPERPSVDGSEGLEEDIRSAVDQFEDRFAEPPAELFVRVEVAPFTARGVIVTPNDVPVIEFSYSLLTPHDASYSYIGPSSTTDTHDERDAEA